MFKFSLYVLTFISFGRISGAWKLRDKVSFPSNEEEFDFGFNSSYENESQYILSVVTVDDDGSKEKFDIVFSVQKVKFSLNEHRMQWLCSKVDPSIRMRLSELDDDLSKPLLA